MNQQQIGQDILDILKFTSSHAFANVILWVAISYFFFELLNYFSKNQFSEIIKNNKNTQPLMGALMGTIPGSGSTLFLLPSYKKGDISFAALTAAFIATMGEVAFILIAQQPILYLWMVLFSFIVALIIGYTLHFLDIEKKFNLSKHLEIDIEEKFKYNDQFKAKQNFVLSHNILNIVVSGVFFIAWLVAIPFFIIEATSLGSDHGHGDHNHDGSVIQVLEWISFIASIILIVGFILKKTVFKKIEKNKQIHFHNFDKSKHLKNMKHILSDTYENSLFIFVWVFFAMLMIEVPFSLIPDLSHDSTNLFDNIWFVIGLIFIGSIISIFPGCGPNLIFTSWFLSMASHAEVQWTLPFAIMMSNGIAQDGDSGFPLLALNKRTYFVMKTINIVVGIVFGLIFIPLTSVLPGISV